MEKTIIIDDKEVQLRSSGATAIRFKMQFKKDFFAEIMKLEGLSKLDFDNLDPDSLDKLDFEVFYNLIWAFAKTANPNIKEPLSWLDEFESFPIVEILPEIQDMILSNLQSKKKI